MELIDSLQQMMERDEAFQSLFQPPRRAGKTGLTTFIIDEFHRLEKLSREPVFAAEFSDPVFPAATVKVFEVITGKRDPRNPNPAAGIARQFIIRVGDRQVGSRYGALPIATIRAKDLHQRLLKALRADSQKQNPDFGRF